MSNFRDLAGLYSPMKDLGAEGVELRIKPKHVVVLNVDENPLRKGPDNDNLRLVFFTISHT